MPTKIYTAFQLFIRQCLLYPLISPFLPPENKVQKDYSYANGALTGTLEGGDQKFYPADQEFVDNGNGTISDLSTGLMWAKDGEGPGCNDGDPLNWDAAVAFAEALEFAGHTDWRLPDMKELQTIIDYELQNPAIDPTYFPNTPIEAFWTSSSYPNVSTFAYYIYLSDGTSYAAHKEEENWLRCVRNY